MNIVDNLNLLNMLSLRNYLRYFLLVLGIVICYGGGKAYREEPQVKRNIVVATWNIGHFANGNRENSLISPIDYNMKLSEYRKLVYTELSPDVICVNEYSKIFGKDRKGNEKTAHTVLFNGFKSRIIGDQKWYSCNAIFSNCRIKNLKKNDFDCCQSYLKDNPKVSQYYYISADLYIGCEEIKMVCLHLYPWDNKIRQEQMRELIEKYKTSKRVLICGDLNTTDFSLFTESGFSIANDGSIITFPIKKMALDNIIVKGLKICDVRAFKTNLSDHYPLVCNIICED